VLKQSYEVTDPTIDSQIVNLKNSGANVFFNITIPSSPCRRSRRPMTSAGSSPLPEHVSSSLGTVLKPAGLEPPRPYHGALHEGDHDPQWKNDKGFLDWVAWMKKYYPEGALDDQSNAFAYNVAILMTQVLKQCGNDLSRENIMKQAANVKNFELPLLLPASRSTRVRTTSRPSSRSSCQVQRRDLGDVRRARRRQQEVAVVARNRTAGGMTAGRFLVRVDRYWPAGERKSGRLRRLLEYQVQGEPGNARRHRRGREYGSTSVPSYPPPGCVQHICGTPSIIRRGPSGTGPRLFPDS